MSDSAVMMAVVVLGILAVAAVGLVRGTRASRTHLHLPDLGVRSDSADHAGRREHHRADH
jgi:hypothetical protein